MAERTTFHVHPERSAPGEISAILAAGVVAHVGLIDPRGPVVIPMSYHFDAAQPGRLYLHGAPHSPLLQAAGAGGRLCVTVTLLDGLVYSRTALYHSVNYRSVVCFGRGAIASDDERTGVLGAMIARYHPGRAAGRDYEHIPNAHLEATVLIAMQIEDATAKVRRGGPKGPRDADPLASGTAGVLDLPKLELPLQR